MGLFDFFSSNKYSTLSDAVLSDNIVAARKMLKAGADPNVTLPSYRNVPLIYIALRKGAKMVQLLIDYGAKINITNGNNGITPLAFAEANDLNEVATVLRKAGACVRSGDEEFAMDPRNMLRMENRIFSLINQYRRGKIEEVADQIYSQLIYEFPFSADMPQELQELIKKEMRILVLRGLGMNAEDEEKKRIKFIKDTKTEMEKSFITEVHAVGGVYIGEAIWATSNVGSPRNFAAKPENYGNHYTWDEAKNVCPKGWRLPTEEEIYNLVNSGSQWTVVNGQCGRKFGSGSNTLFLPAVGGTLEKNTNALFVDKCGSYWSSEKHNEGNALYLYFDNTNAAVQSYSRSVAFNIRCVFDKKEK